MQAQQKGVAALGVFGNFFSAMPSVMQSALVLDSETTGVGKGHAVFEVALKDVAGGRPIEYYIAPGRVIESELGGKTTFQLTRTMKELEGFSQQWSRNRMAKGAQFDYLHDYFADSKHLKEIEATGKTTVGKRVFLSPERFFQKLSQDLGASESRALYIANINFENRVLSDLLTTTSPQLQQEVKQRFQSYSPTRSGKFLYRSTDIQPFVTRASETGEAADWAKVGERMRKGAPAANLGIFKYDIQDLGKAAMAEARLLGAVDTTDFFTGQNVEAQKLAYGLKGGGHIAAKDVLLEGEILGRQHLASARMAAFRRPGLGGFATGMHALITGGGLLDDIQAQQRVQSVQRMTKFRGLLRQLAHLELYRTGDPGVEPFQYRPHEDSFMAPTRERTAGSAFREVRQQIKWRPPVDLPKDEITRWLSVANKNLHLEQYGFDAETAYREHIRGRSPAHLKNLFESGAALKAETAWTAKLAGTMAEAPTWGRGQLAKQILKRHPIASGLSALAIFSGLSSLGGDDIPDYDDAANISADTSNTKLQRAKADIAQRQAKAQGQIRQFSAQELTRTSGEPLEGVKNTANLQRVKLDMFDVLADDADTLILREKNHGWFSKGKPVVIRLAGIDAPETKHDLLEDPLGPYRVKQSQPGGEAATGMLKSMMAQGDLSLYIDPSQETYGRHVGMLFAGGQNVNLELVRRGQAAALDYRTDTMTADSMFAGAQRRAQRSSMGMWNIPFWRTYAATGGSRYTFNALTHGIRLQQDPQLMALHQAMWAAGAQPRLIADDDAHNTIVGMQHGGSAQQMRQSMTEFGSGWRGMWNSLKSIGNLFSRGRIPANLIDPSSVVMRESALVPKGFGGMAAGPKYFKKALAKSNLSGKRRQAVEAHMSAMKNLGIPQVAAVKSRRYAAHEFGHIMTTGRKGVFTKEAMDSLNRSLKSDRLKDAYRKITRAHGSSPEAAVIRGHEFAAESVSAYYASAMGKRFRPVGANWSEKLTESNILAMSALGRDLLRTSPYHKQFKSIKHGKKLLDAVPNTSGNDDVANSLTGIFDGTGADASRTGLGIPFGSGWHGADYQLPYQLSLSEGRQSKIYGGMAREAHSDIKRTQFTEGRHAVGITSLQATGLPPVAYEYPKPRITIQTESSMRPIVDQNVRSLINSHHSRKYRDRARKFTMAHMQNATSATMFYNSKYGARGHVTQ